MAGAGDEPASAAEVRRFKLTVAYDGSKFHGWQRQTLPAEQGGGSLRTVQGVLEEALRRLLGQPILVRGASRTDAGVHAMGQVAVFDAACPIPLENLVKATNSRLPHDVDVREAEVVDRTFDVADAITKQYRYRIWNTTRRPLGIRHMVYHFWTPVDVDRMNDAAARLVGTHDFDGFATVGHGRLSTVRTIHACRIERVSGEEVQLVIEGDGFLYNMVRIIAGTLLEIGRGHWEPSRIEEILASKDRRLAGPTAPAPGLCLQWIRYA